MQGIGRASAILPALRLQQRKPCAFGIGLKIDTYMADVDASVRGRAYFKAPPLQRIDRLGGISLRPGRINPEGEPLEEPSVEVVRSADGLRPRLPPAEPLPAKIFENPQFIPVIMLYAGIEGMPSGMPQKESPEIGTPWTQRERFICEENPDRETDEQIWAWQPHANPAGAANVMESGPAIHERRRRGRPIAARRDTRGNRSTKRAQKPRSGGVISRARVRARLDDCEKENESYFLFLLRERRVGLINGEGMITGGAQRKGRRSITIGRRGIRQHRAAGRQA